ncbi:UNVERIFIED_CONTAM: hypothetical protein K2H54_065936 [Gekko kuhli]
METKGRGWLNGGRGERASRPLAGLPKPPSSAKPGEPSKRIPSGGHGSGSLALAPGGSLKSAVGMPLERPFRSERTAEAH